MVAKATTEISNEVMDILRQCTITENRVMLPATQLGRKLYLQVNTVLSNAGGKWNKSAKAHIFPSDPRPKLGLALETGVTTDTKKENQAYFTPIDIADMLVEWANVKDCLVLEPSAGEGALVQSCLRHGATGIMAVEKSQEYAAILDLRCYENPLKRDNRVAICVADFLEMEVTMPFDRVVMNPPFTNNQDVKHVEHAMKFLVSGGILVSIMANNQTRATFKKLVDKWHPEVVELQDGAFKNSGTNVRTIMIRIVKP